MPPSKHFTELKIRLLKYGNAHAASDVLRAACHRAVGGMNDQILETRDAVHDFLGDLRHVLTKHRAELIAIGYEDPVIRLEFAGTTVAECVYLVSNSTEDDVEVKENWQDLRLMRAMDLDCHLNGNLYGKNYEPRPLDELLEVLSSGGA